MERGVNSNTVVTDIGLQIPSLEEYKKIKSLKKKSYFMSLCFFYLPHMHQVHGENYGSVDPEE
jgi:hypothetical protein